jgi:serine/threonine-protein kinase
MLQNRYRIVRLLGQGGFGAVYRAWDTRLDGAVAVKENFDTSQEAAVQFEREARMLFKLKHPNLPRVIDHFIVPNQGQYLVMDFVDGEDLQEKLNRAGGYLPESQVIPWIEQICDALFYLHSQNPPIIHRDIKPANIKITPENKAVLVDFGIAKVYDSQLATTAGARAVTPGYSPPEQYGRGITDARTDVYALGATLYSLLTGVVPPESVDLLANHQNHATSPRILNPRLSVIADSSITRAMLLDNRQRFQSVNDFKTALRTGDVVEKESPRSSKWLYGLGAVVILGLLILGITSIWPEGDQALESTQLAIALQQTQTAMAVVVQPSDTPTDPPTDPPPTLAPTQPTFTPLPTYTPLPTQPDQPTYTPLPTYTAIPPTPTQRPPTETPRAYILSPYRATASDQTGNSVDSEGNTTTFDPENTLDGRLETAWRVPGNGRGEWLEITFRDSVFVNGVGIVPGYDKIDPYDGVDRFYQNYVVKTVILEFSDGTRRECSFEHRRDMKFCNVGGIRTTYVRIVITDTYPPSSPDPRETTPISEVQIIGWDA